MIDPVTLLKAICFGVPTGVVIWMIFFPASPEIE